MLTTAYLKYLTIPYKHQGDTFQGADCFGLLRLFYLNELGIVIPTVEFSYAEKWWESNNYFIDLYEQYGFKNIPLAYKQGDLILFKNNNSHPGHVGIVLDDSNFIHMNRSGCGVACYQYGVWARQIHSTYRYNNDISIR